MTDGQIDGWTNRWVWSTESGPCAVATTLAPTQCSPGYGGSSKGFVGLGLSWVLFWPCFLWALQGCPPPAGLLRSLLATIWPRIPILCWPHSRGTTPWAADYAPSPPPTGPAPVWDPHFRIAAAHTPVWPKSRDNAGAGWPRGTAGQQGPPLQHSLPGMLHPGYCLNLLGLKSLPCPCLTGGNKRALKTL